MRVDPTVVLDKLTRGSDRTGQISLFGDGVIVILPYNGWVPVELALLLWNGFEQHAEPGVVTCSPRTYFRTRYYCVGTCLSSSRPPFQLWDETGLAERRLALHERRWTL